MAHGYAHRLAGYGDLEPSAATGCSVGGHFAAILNASRTSASSVVSAPSSSFAAATAALASAGLKPRLARAERASAATPPRGAEAPAAPASAGLPSLPASSLTIRWASLGPTPLARLTIALSPREMAAA